MDRESAFIWSDGSPFAYINWADIGMYYRAVVSGGARGALAPPEVESSVNPIPTRGGRLCPPQLLLAPPELKT